MEPTLQELTVAWYDIVCVDHHKDRDCHFYINHVYSYGHKPYYRLEHYGYISDFPDELSNEQYATHDDAEAALTKWLYGEVKEMLKSYNEIDDTYDYNVKGAKLVYEKYKHLLI